MIEVKFYTRKECNLCDIAKQELEEILIKIPHKLSIIDVDSDSNLIKEYGLSLPVIVVGPYTLRAPIDKKDLEITIKAAIHRENQINDIDAAITDGTIPIPVNWTKADQFSLWLSKHYLAAFNIFVLIYLALPFIAPVLLKVGATVPAGWIYRAYGAVCHQLAYRSWFLFGEQAVYPRQSANLEGILTYGQATGLSENDLWTARSFRGTELIGYKVALCERDVAIYGGILLFGILFSLTRRRIKSLNWLVWIILGILPIGIDGVSQLLSQPPFYLFAYRESTPLIRSITGFLFGFLSAWFGYPYVEDSMRENRHFLDRKKERILTFLKKNIAPSANENN